MLIYSRWRPEDGGYDYFESDEAPVPLGNDLPEPRLSPIGSIGVPSVGAGRSLPSNAVFVGSGATALGVVTRTVDNGVTIGALTRLTASPIACFAAGAAIIGAIWWFSRD